MRQAEQQKSIDAWKSILSNASALCPQSGERSVISSFKKQLEAIEMKRKLAVPVKEKAQ